MVFLISEKYIKSNSGLDNNLFGKFLLPAMREAQEIDLQSIIGTNLYESLIEKVETDSLDGCYKFLVNNYIRPYLMYRVLSNIIPLISTKIANIGTVINKDDKLVTLTEEEKNNLMDYWTFRADFYCKRMQRYILKNNNSIKEISGADRQNLIANLDSSASCNVWLGGIRGRK